MNSDSPEDLREHGLRLGRYSLIRRIAYGGMAEIFLAADTGVGGISRQVVVKRILPNITEDPAFVEMFLDEARIAARLTHPNIVHVYDFGESDGQYYIAMEYVEGASLANLLNALRPELMPMEHAVKIASALGQALYYAHSLRDPDGGLVGVIHRDVSPQNVLLSSDGTVKLVDFGIARAKDQIHRTEAGVLKGKYAYMAPEQCVGKGYDHRVDIFSLGTLLHESLTTSRLFKRENIFQTMRAVTTEPIPPPSAKRPELPPELDAIVMRALARDPDDRYPTAEDLAVDLEGFLHEARLQSNQILLGRFVRNVIDETHQGEGADEGSSSSAGWSRARDGEAASDSDVSRLRKVVTKKEGEGAPAEDGEPPAEQEKAPIETLEDSVDGPTLQQPTFHVPPPPPFVPPAGAGTDLPGQASASADDEDDSTAEHPGLAEATPADDAPKAEPSGRSFPDADEDDDSTAEHVAGVGPAPAGEHDPTAEHEGLGRADEVGDDDETGERPSLPPEGLSDGAVERGEAPPSGPAATGGASMSPFPSPGAPVPFGAPQKGGDEVAAPEKDPAPAPVRLRPPGPAAAHVPPEDESTTEVPFHGDPTAADHRIPTEELDLDEDETVLDSSGPMHHERSEEGPRASAAPAGALSAAEPVLGEGDRGASTEEEALSTAPGVVADAVTDDEPVPVLEEIDADVDSFDAQRSRRAKVLLGVGAAVAAVLIVVIGAVLLAGGEPASSPGPSAEPPPPGHLPNAPEPGPPPPSLAEPGPSPGSVAVPPSPSPAEVPVAPAGAPMGTLTMVVEEGDSVAVDGEAVELPELADGIALPVGDHEVRVERSGHRAWTETVSLTAGETATVDPAPAALPGRVFVNSRPWSNVYINGRKIGTTPIVAHPLPAGSYRARLETADGKVRQRSLRVRPGRPTKVFVGF